jgi:hypothetical protein
LPSDGGGQRQTGTDDQDLRADRDADDLSTYTVQFTRSRWLPKTLPMCAFRPLKTFDFQPNICEFVTKCQFFSAGSRQEHNRRYDWPGIDVPRPPWDTGMMQWHMPDSCGQCFGLPGL